MQMTSSLIDKTVLKEVDLPPWVNELDDDTSGIILRTLCDFEIRNSTNNEYVSLYGIEEVTRNGCNIFATGSIIEPYNSEWKNKIFSVLCNSHQSAPASVDEMSFTCAPPPSRRYKSHSQSDGNNDGVIVPLDRDNLKEGDSIDGYCTKTYKWYESKIVKVDKGKVLIHFRGWNSKHDEWIDTNSNRLASKGSSITIMYEEAKKISNMIPWYDDEEKLNRRLKQLYDCDIPDRRRVSVNIDVEDWCIDYTYANPTLWLISTGGIWYRIAGAFCPGNSLGSPTAGYYHKFKHSIETFYCSSHIVMCLLDYLPTNPRLTLDSIIEEVTIRSNGVINEDVILSNYTFLIEQISALEKPVDWIIKVDFPKLVCVQQLAKRGNTYSRERDNISTKKSEGKGGSKKGTKKKESFYISNDNSADGDDDEMIIFDGDDNNSYDDASLSNDRYSVVKGRRGYKRKKGIDAVAVSQSDDLHSVDVVSGSIKIKIQKTSIVSSLRNPIDDVELFRLEMEAGTVFEPYPMPLDSVTSLDCPANLCTYLVRTWSFLVNLRSYLKLPHMSPEFLLSLLRSNSTATSNGVHFVLKNIHISLLVKIYADRIKNNTKICLKVSDEQDLYLNDNDQEEVPFLDCLLLPGCMNDSVVLAVDDDTSDSKKKMEERLHRQFNIGTCWFEALKVLAAEYHHVSISQYTDPIGEIIRILEYILKEADATYFLDDSIANSNTGNEAANSLPLGLNRLLSRVQDGYYESNTFSISTLAPTVSTDSSSSSSSSSSGSSSSSSGSSSSSSSSSNLIDFYSEALKHWYAAKIVRLLEDNQAVVHILSFGVSNVYDEVIRLDSPRILPHLSVSSNGQQRHLSPSEQTDVSLLDGHAIGRDVHALTSSSSSSSTSTSTSSSSSKRNSGYAAIVDDINTAFIGYQTYYSDKDDGGNAIVDAAKYLHELFSKMYSKRVAPLIQKLENSFVNTVNTSRRYDGSSSSSNDDEWKDMMDKLTKSDYGDCRLDVQLKLLSWLCDQLLSTSDCRSYIEELAEIKFQHERQSRQRSSKSSQDIVGDTSVAAIAPTAGKSKRLSKGGAVVDHDNDILATTDQNMAYMNEKFPEYQTMYTKLTPLGTDRDGRVYWVFPRDTCATRIFVEIDAGASWLIYTHIHDIHSIYNWLHDMAIKESKLQKSLLQWMTASNLPLPEPKSSSRKQQRRSSGGSLSAIAADTTPAPVASTNYHSTRRKSVGATTNEDEAVTTTAMVEVTTDTVDSPSTGSSHSSATAAATTTYAPVEVSSEVLNAYLKEWESVSLDYPTDVSSYGNIEYNSVCLTISIDLSITGSLGITVKEFGKKIVVTGIITAVTQSFGASPPSSGQMAGIRVGDQIVAANGRVTKTTADIQEAVRDTKELNHRIVNLLVMRSTHDVLTLKLKDIPDGFRVSMQDALSAQRKIDRIAAKQFIDTTTSSSLSTTVATTPSFFHPLHDQNQLPNHLLAIVIHLLQFSLQPYMNAPTGWDIKSATYLCQIHQLLLLSTWSTDDNCKSYCYLLSSSSYPQECKCSVLYCNECLCSLRSHSAIVERLVMLLSTILLDVEHVLSNRKEYMHPIWYSKRTRSLWRQNCSNSISLSQVSSIAAYLLELIMFHDINTHFSPISLNEYNVMLSNYTHLHKTPLMRSYVLYYSDGHKEHTQIEKELNVLPMFNPSVNVVNACAVNDGIVALCEVISVRIIPCGPKADTKRCIPFAQVELALQTSDSATVRHYDEKYRKHVSSSTMKFMTSANTTATAAAIAIAPSTTTAPPAAITPSTSSIHVVRLNRIILRIIAILSQIEESQPFQLPVNPKVYPDYANIVHNPRDFSYVNRMAWDRLYLSADEFLCDMRLIRDNCRAFCTDKFPELVDIADKLHDEAVDLMGYFSNEIHTPIPDDDVHCSKDSASLPKKFMVNMHLDKRFPSFLISHEKYTHAYDRAMIEDKFTITTYVTDEADATILQQESSGTTVGCKTVHNSYIPWNWLTVEWIDAADLESSTNSTSLNAWDLYVAKDVRAVATAASTTIANTSSSTADSDRRKASMSKLGVKRGNYKKKDKGR